MTERLDLRTPTDWIHTPNDDPTAAPVALAVGLPGRLAGMAINQFMVSAAEAPFTNHEQKARVVSASPSVQELRDLLQNADESILRLYEMLV